MTARRASLQLPFAAGAHCGTPPGMKPEVWLACCVRATSSAGTSACQSRGTRTGQEPGRPSRLIWRPDQTGHGRRRPGARRPVRVTNELCKSGESRGVARRAAGGPPKAEPAADAGPAARAARRLDQIRLNSARDARTATRTDGRPHWRCCPGRNRHRLVWSQFPARQRCPVRASRRYVAARVGADDRKPGLRIVEAPARRVRGRTAFWLNRRGVRWSADGPAVG